jgi:O-antigen ligase
MNLTGAKLMANIYNFLKNVFQDIKSQTNSNPIFFWALLLLVTIPFLYAVNNIVLAIFLLITILKFRKENVSFNTFLILPILLFLWMGLSYFWSIDAKTTLKAIPKEITLLLIPIAFGVNKKFTAIQVEKIKKYYSYSMVVLAVFFLLRAIVRYLIDKDSRVFFYHGEDYIDFGLVPKLLNAIHVSVFAAVALFYFVSKEVKTKFETVASIILFAFIMLLSSKNIIVVVLLLGLLYFFYFSKSSQKLRLRNLIVFGLVLGLLFSFGKIKNRFIQEFKSNTDKSISTNVLDNVPQGVHYVSLKEAWTNETFTPNDYFPGTAFRVYQFRIFTEIISENNAYLLGFGLNSSTDKIAEKAKNYNLFLGDDKNEGYHDKNFHNQYVQNFADLGFIGFVLLLIIVLLNLKNAIKNKDFVHFAFAILMISLFLTESFLWRQRGVVFFTFFYCLFNSNVLKSNPKN